MKIQRKIDDHIRGRQRPQDRVKTGQTLAVQTPPQAKKQAFTPISGLTWDAQYFINQRYSRQQSSNMVFTANTLTYSHTDSGIAGSGSWSGANKQWTDGAKAWTNDEWIDHYLKVNGLYYLITDNTATILTIELNGQDEPDDSLAYTIVPFIPDQLIGALLVPDNTATKRRLKILDNTETVITIEMTTVTSGEVTTGDASAPYNTFIDTSKKGNTADDNWNDYTIKFTSGANNGEKKTVSDYTDSTGTFVTGNFTNAIAVGDDYDIRDDLLWASTGATFEIQKYNIPAPADFVDTTLISAGDVAQKQVVTGFGEINEANLPAYTNIIYSIKIKASTTMSLALPLDCKDSIKISLKNIDTGAIDIIVDSGFAPNQEVTATFNLVENTEYRIDIAFYAEDGGYGFKFANTPESIGFFISAWDSALLSPPEWVSISGGTATTDPGVKDREIELRIKSPADWFGEMTKTDL